MAFLRCVLVFGLTGLFGMAAAGPTPAPAALSLKKTDTVVGKGREALAGKRVTVHYSGWLYSPKADKQHGMLVDSSAGAAPFSFELGAGKVIKGWDLGLVGMKSGGKRTLVVPAALAYGQRGAGPVPPGANLIFDVELLDVK
jgi:FKBP-type peptidyl-prolyl cis-trans isomerase FkpA